jgi:raffinose/stachyose/melibiose transport system permease protein
MDAEPELASRAVAVGGRGRRARRERREAERLPGEPRRIAYLYVAPAFLLYAAFNLLPLGQGVNDSLYDWDGITPGRWVGLSNYGDFFTDPTIRSGYIHVLELMIFYSFLPIAIGLFLAAVLSRIRIRGLTVFRLLLFLPLVITDVVTAVAWTWVYDVDGPLSTALRALGLGHLIPSQGWLGDFHTALPAVGIFGLWGQFGFALILFLAGVMKIPASLYEAARVDGANAVREFFAVTLPGLRYELQVVLVLTVIGTLGTFDEVYIMTNGGPGTATTVPAYVIWRRMFQTGQVGSAAALGIALMLVTFLVVWVINRLMERGVESS